MPKAKLSAAALPTTTSKAAASKAAQVTSSAAAADTDSDSDAPAADRTDADSDSDDEPAAAGGDDDDTTPTGKASDAPAGKADVAPAAAGTADRPLAAYRETFGHADGSVLFADQTPFVDACVAHIGTLNAQLATLTTANAELQESNATLAKAVHGERNPLELDAEDKAARKGTSAAADPVDAFAAAQRDKLAAT